MSRNRADADHSKPYVFRVVKHGDSTLSAVSAALSWRPFFDRPTPMTIAQLRTLFSGDEWPRFEQMHTTEGGFVIELFLDPSIRWFAGHFPDQPVLAGVVQTHWAAELGRALFNIEGEFAQIDNLKFQSVLVPGQTVSLQLTYLADKGWLKFRFDYDGQSFSQGKLAFGD